MSFEERPNYSVRPNKAVERRVIFAGLKRISREIDLSRFTYVGLGSPWFVDFVMAHKHLGITSLYSMEWDGYPATRAKFNRPLSCVTVLEGDTTRTIPTIDLARAPTLAWLDYEASINGPVLDDIELVIERVTTNSIVIATINADKRSLPNKDANDKALTPEDSLRRLAGDLVPTTLVPKAFQPLHYAKLLCEILTNKFESLMVHGRRPEKFVKLFELVYRDGSPMATVGGMLADPELAPRIEGLTRSADWEGIAVDPIVVPPLTIKEKCALDQLLPAATPPSDNQMTALGFQLGREQLTAYHRYYRYYPMYGEFDF